METVRVKGWGEGHEEGVIINKEDFDAEKHELFEAPKAEKPPAKPKAEKSQK